MRCHTASRPVLYWFHAGPGAAKKESTDYDDVVNTGSCANDAMMMVPTQE